MSAESHKKDIFPAGEPAPADYFTGIVRVKALVPHGDIYNCQIANVVFEPGARTNWHTHAGGQILIVTHGMGCYQEKGKSIQMLHPGDVITIPPQLVHWHGAAPETGLTHIAVNTNSNRGIAEWLSPVTDEEYTGREPI